MGLATASTVSRRSPARVPSERGRGAVEGRLRREAKALLGLTRALLRRAPNMDSAMAKFSLIALGYSLAVPP